MVAEEEEAVDESGRGPRSMTITLSWKFQYFSDPWASSGTKMP